MNRKQFIIIGVLCVLLVIIVGIIFWIFNNFGLTDKSITEQQKTNVQEVSVSNDTNTSGTQPVLQNNQLALAVLSDSIKPDEFLQWDVTSNTYFDVNQKYSVKIKYPQLVKYTNQEVQDSFNKLNQNYVDKRVKEIQSLPEVQYQSVMKPFSEITYKVFYLSDTYISYRYYENIFAGGGTNDLQFTSKNYDLILNRELTLDDIFKDSNKAKITLDNFVLQALNSKYSIDFSKQLTDSNKNFGKDLNFDSNGIYVSIGKYNFMLGPATPEVFIPFSLLDKGDFNQDSNFYKAFILK
jgi:flagellar basal body-associated protein FliL